MLNDSELRQTNPFKAIVTANGLKYVYIVIFSGQTCRLTLNTTATLDTEDKTNIIMTKNTKLTCPISGCNIETLPENLSTHVLEHPLYDLEHALKRFMSTILRQSHRFTKQTARLISKP